MLKILCSNTTDKLTISMPSVVSLSSLLTLLKLNAFMLILYMDRAKGISEKSLNSRLRLNTTEHF